MGARLVKAARNGRLDDVRELVEKHGVDVNEVNIVSQTALFAAATNNHVEVVRYLLDHQADINARDLGTRTALMDCSLWGQAEALELLLQRGADMELVDLDGRTALIIAAKCGFVQCVRSLLAHGAAIDTKDKKASKTALDYASENGHREICDLLETKARGLMAAALSLIQASREGHQAEVERLLRADGVDVNVVGENNWTPLLWAARQGHSDIVRLVIVHGANVDWRGFHNSSALMLAAQQGHLRVVNLLLEHHAAIDLIDKDGDTALMCAAWGGHIQIVQNLIQYGARTDVKNLQGLTAMDYASRNGQTEVVQLLERIVVDQSGDALLKAVSAGQHEHVFQLLQTPGINVDMVDSSGFTPLMHAISNKYADIAIALLKLNADVNAADQDGDTALMLAVRNSNVHIVCKLLLAGADAHATNRLGYTALLIAAGRGNMGIVIEILKKNVNVDVSDDLEGYTPLMVATYFGFGDVVRILVKYGANMNMVGRNGKIAFLMAAEGSHMSIMRLLLEQGVIVAVSDLNGDTPLIIAVKKSHVEMVQMLLENGADASTKNNEGHSALSIALEKNLHTIARLLIDDKAVKASWQLLQLAKVDQMHNISHLLNASGINMELTGEDGKNALMYASEHGNVNSIQALLCHSPTLDLNKVDADGNSALMLAAMHGHAAVAQKLLDHGADINLVNTHRKSALLLAAASGYTDFMLLLLDQPVDVNIVDENGESALFHVAKAGQVTVARKLLESGALMDCQCRDKKNVFAVANEYGHDEMAQLFLNYARNQQALLASHNLMQAARDGRLIDVEAALEIPGVNIDLVDEDVCTPLMLAAQRGDEEVVKILLAYNANVNSVQNKGRSALMLAVEKGILDIVCLLLNNGANANAVDESGESALTCAIRYGHVEIIRKLVNYESQINVEALSGARYDNIDSGSTPAISTEQVCVRTVTSLPSMEKIHSQCGRMNEAEKMCVAVYDRLADLSILVTGKPQAYASFSKTLQRFDAFLTKYSGKRLITRLVSSRMIIDTCETFHNKLDELMQSNHLDIGKGVHNWKAQFKSETDSQRKFFKEAMTTKKDALIVECQDPAVQKETLILLLFESNQRKAKYSADALTLIKQITNYVAGFSRLGIPSLPRWFIPPHEVEYDLRPFAGGSYGSVHRGRWEGTDVVVKLVLDDEESRAIFLEEAEVWTELHHPHLVKLYGACHVGNPFFVCEFASNGTLVEYLGDEKHSHVMWKKLYEAALGLQHMHTKKNMVHRDLKCNNILVGADEKAKISDFGLSCLEANLSKTGVVTEVGAIAWKAPECITGEVNGSFAADIYSFGMCILEATTGERPWGMMDDVAIKFRLLTLRELPKQPSSITSQQWQLIEKMCAFDPLDRIDITAVVKQLQVFTEEEEDAYMAKDWEDYVQQQNQLNM